MRNRRHATRAGRARPPPRASARWPRRCRGWHPSRCRPSRSVRGSRSHMKSHTDYMTFNTDSRRKFVRITDDVQRAVDQAGIAEGMVLVSAMHITAAVWINDDEPGIQADALEWLDKLAPPSWQPPANDVARELLPDPGDYRHHRGGEDNGDAHLKNRLGNH